MKMNMRRWLMLLPVALLCPTWALADVIAGPDFNITIDGFLPGENFGGAPDGQPNPEFPTFPCLGTNCDQTVIIDPLIKLNPGGHSPGVGLDGFTFSADENGVGSFDFLNTSGQTFTTLQISFTLTKDEFDAQIAAGEVYECDGGPYFATCNFQVIDPIGNDQVLVNFGGGLGIPSAVPEPAQWMILSLAFAGIVIARRKLRPNSAYSRN
jgi:hypothetical protein